MANRYILITGRSTKQGTSTNVGKRSAEFLQATSIVGINTADLAQRSFNEGDRVRIRSVFGEAVAQVTKSDDVPVGIVFMAYGPLTSQLMGGDTAATGMPESKGLEVEIDRVAGNGD